MTPPAPVLLPRRRARPSTRHWFAAALQRPLLLAAAVAKLAAVPLWALAGQPKLAIACFAAPDPFLLYALFVPSASGLCHVATRFATRRRAVWLTIDDGPDEDDTPRILEALDAHGARATFFVTGERAERFPELVAEIARRGHEVAHHTHTHPAATFWCASPSRLAAELDGPLAVLEPHGLRPTRFRAPVGIKHLLLGPALASRGLTYVGWSIRSGDCLGRRAGAVVASVMRRVEPGAIILLHEGRSLPPALRVRTISLLLTALAARGFTCEIPDAGQLR